MRINLTPKELYLIIRGLQGEPLDTDNFTYKVLLQHLVEAKEKEDREDADEHNRFFPKPDSQWARELKEKKKDD